MTETEGTQSGASGSESSAPGSRKTGARKKAPRKRSAASGARRKTVTARKTARKGRKRAIRQRSALNKLLKGLAKKASDARGRVVDFSEEQAGAAKRAAGKVAASSKKTIARVKKEWNGMDNARKATFVAALLGALAAASGSIAAGRKKK